LTPTTTKMLKPLSNGKWHEINIPTTQKDFYLKKGWQLAEKQSVNKDKDKEKDQDKEKGK
jgi:hypothetical protein